jgi:hypothetical protein
MDEFGRATFRDLTVDCIRDGSFASTDELIASIEEHLKDRDLSPKRYLWKAEGQSILEKIQIAKEALQKETIV